MIGIFLKNENGKLCFVQPPQETRREISAFRYSRDSHTVVVAFADGEEELFTMEVAPELRGSFLTSTSVLVVHVDAKREFEQEYVAAMTIT